LRSDPAALLTGVLDGVERAAQEFSWIGRHAQLVREVPGALS
jgi:hypothetical protein